MTCRILVRATAMGRRSVLGAGGFRVYSLGRSRVCLARGRQGAGRGVLLPPESAVWLGTGRTRVCVWGGAVKGRAECGGRELETPGWMAKKEQAGRWKDQERGVTNASGGERVCRPGTGEI